MILRLAFAATALLMFLSIDAMHRMLADPFTVAVPGAATWAVGPWAVLGVLAGMSRTTTQENR